MKSSKDKLKIAKHQDDIIDSAYRHLITITKKSNSVIALIDQVQAYLRENPAPKSLLENPLKTHDFIIKILNEDVLHKQCDSKEDLERYRIYLGCLAIHIIKNADPSLEEEEVIYDCIDRVIKNIYLKLLEDSLEPSRKYSFYGNIRSILIEEFEEYIDLYFEDDNFRDLIFKLFKEENEFLTLKNANFTPSSTSVIHYFNHYVRFLNELKQTNDSDGLFEIENANLRNILKNSSASIYSNCESFYQKLIEEIEAILDEQIDFIENESMSYLIEDFKALNTTLKLLSSSDSLDKNIKDGLKKFETKMFPKLYSNFTKETSSLFEKAEQAQIEYSANQILETYKKYEKLVNQGATVKLNDELCQFVTFFYNHPSDIYQRGLIKSLLDSLIKPKNKIKIADPTEKEIHIFYNLHKISLFILIYKRITANQLITLQELDINKYFTSTNTDNKISKKKQVSQTNSKSSSKDKRSEENKKQIQTISRAKSSPKQVPLSVISASTEKPKIEAASTQNKKVTKVPSKKGNKNRKNRSKKKNSTLSAVTLSTQTVVDLSNPTEIITNEFSDSAPQLSVKPKIERFLSYVPLAASNHMNRISQSGYQAFMFGGAVRDILWKDLGRNDDLKYNDIDLISDIPEQIFIDLFPFAEKSKFIANLWHVRHAGDNYGLITVDIKLVPELNLEKLFSESYLAVDSLACDLNGKIYDPLDVLDKFLMPELHLVTTEKPHFKNNPERILKAIKTASHLPADLSEPLVQMIIEHKQELSNLDLSHMLSLLARICLKQQGDIGFKTLVRLELIDSLFPILGEKIQSCSSRNTVIHNFMHQKFKSFNGSDLPFSKYSLLAVFLIPYYERMMSLDKKYYSEEEIKSKFDTFLTHANIKPNEKSLWAKRTLQCFMRYWKEFEAFELGIPYSSYSPGFDQFKLHDTDLSVETSIEVTRSKLIS
ncbi:MAG: hypothetical protein U1E78_10495 [Gammaproteobacteria bacterium]